MSWGYVATFFLRRTPLLLLVKKKRGKFRNICRYELEGGGFRTPILLHIWSNAFMAEVIQRASRVSLKETLIWRVDGCDLACWQFWCCRSSKALIIAHSRWQHWEQDCFALFPLNMSEIARSFLFATRLEDPLSSLSAQGEECRVQHVP